MSIETFTYPNGFRVIYQKSYNSSPVTHIHAFCNVGSVYETDDIRGASHFIEHMCFKGTNKIPKTKQLLLYYDKIGAYFNAHTEKRHTAYTLKCMDEYLVNSIQIMSDMILNSKFSTADFKTEEMVVIEENVQDSDDLFGSLIEITNKLIYNGSSFQYPVDHILYHKKKYNYDKILNFYHTFYQPSRIVLSVVSNMPFNQIKRMLKPTYFVKKKPTDTQLFQFIQYNLQPQQEAYIVLKNKSHVNTTHITISFRTLKTDKYVLKLLKNILSSTFNSRLFMLLRNDEGLTYTCNVFTETNEHSGGFTIYAETNKSKLFKNGSKPGVFPIIIHMIRSLIQKGVTQPEMELTKGFIRGNMNMMLEQSEKLVCHNGFNYLIYPNEPVIEMSSVFEKCYRPITQKQVNDAIRKYFSYNNMSVCMIGSDLPKEEKIRKFCKKLGT